MITFEIKDMTCGHCVGSITKAIGAVDRGARVTADLTAHRVHIEPTESNVAELGDAIREAGYTPVPITAEAKPVEPSAPRGGGCCC